MSGIENCDGRNILLIEVERVHAAEGSFSIYQASGRCIGDIEDTVTALEERGLFFRPPEFFDSTVVRPRLKHTPMTFPDYEDLSTTVYLAGPCLDTTKTS